MTRITEAEVWEQRYRALLEQVARSESSRPPALVCDKASYELGRLHGVAVPEGYALVSIDALKAWGKYAEVKNACSYPR